MTLEPLLRLVAQAIYLWVAGVTLLVWARQRDRSHRDIALAFVSLAAAIIAENMLQWIPAWAPVLTPTFFLAILAQPHFVLRVARYSVRVPAIARRLVLGGLLAGAASLLLMQAAPVPVTVFFLGYFVAAESYAALLLGRGAAAVSGLPARRLRLAALGSGLLVLIFLLAFGLFIWQARGLLVSRGGAVVNAGLQGLAILSSLSYYFGFAPPRWLRRVWQLEELHAFLRQSSAREADRAPAFERLPAASMRAVGAAGAVLARYSASGNCLTLEQQGAPLASLPDLENADGELARVWREQRSRLLILPAELSDPLERWAGGFKAQALYLVPLTGSIRPRGLLLLALRHLPLFTTDDLELLDLLSEQSSIQLDHAALVEKLSEANRLLEQRIAEQARSEQKFRGLLESAPDAMIVVDEQGVIQLLNSQTENIFGYDRAELLGQSIEILVPKRFQRKHVRHREGYYIDHPARPMGTGLELFGVRKNGTEFPVEISLGPLELEDRLLVSAAIRDVTQRKRIEEEIQKLNHDLEQRAAQLEAANRELESFSYSVSHDLRAPLRSIDGFSQALLEDFGEEIPTEGRTYLERVRAAAQRMAELIDDLLNLSRVTRASLRPSFMNLSALAQEIAQSLQQQEPGRRVDFAIAPDLMVTADPHLLRLVLENLLSNAWKFTSKRPHARIEFGQQNKSKERTFFVSDNGVGFDMAYVDKLFGVFQRLHSVSEYPGTGVGLATVQRIIKIHGGKIWAESERDKRTTFYFTL